MNADELLFYGVDYALGNGKRNIALEQRHLKVPERLLEIILIKNNLPLENQRLCLRNNPGFLLFLLLCRLPPPLFTRLLWHPFRRTLGFGFLIDRLSDLFLE